MPERKPFPAGRRSWTQLGTTANDTRVFDELAAGVAGPFLYRLGPSAAVI
ncbi:hypothetical protein C6A87_002000 [Mycobacterium sp. ITM-2016-00317]|nr:hypothetical protein [Mycobacterium sp. ITM-2016-00317]WNG88070.1 hypothetical protein C6A87_002000 [Mycobacterium sp. ITM-2016-00317]